MNSPDSERNRGCLSCRETIRKFLKEYRKTVFTEWMFPSLRKPGQWLEPTYVRKRLHARLERAGCKDVRFHDLRHTFATMALEHGMDIKTLSVIIGHASSATTMDVYAHVTDEMQRSAALCIDKGITGVVAPVSNDKEKKESAPKQEFQPVKWQRRRRGTGYVTQISENLWEGRYSPRLPDGSEYVRDVYVHTKEECEEKLAALILEMKKEITELKLKAQGGQK